MKTTIALLIAMVTMLSLRTNAQGFFSNFNQPDLPGERRAVIDIELRGVAISSYTVRCFYSTDSMKVVRALSNLAQPGDVSIATAKRDALGTDKMRCSIIFPHSKHPTPNSNDVRPQQIGAPKRVYCAWVRSNPIQDAREPMSATSPVFGFKMPRLLIISYSGDSYASGEGAPNSNVPNVSWNDDGVGGKCHRSNKSGGIRAIKKVIAEHPEWAIRYVNVTCSGATLDDFTASDQRDNLIGAPDFTKDPQLKQIADWLKANNRKVVDIFLTDGGGNDIGFAPIGTAGLTAFFADISKDERVKERASKGLDDLPRKYEDVNDALVSEEFGFSVGRVVWFNYPSPLTDKNGRLCSPASNGNNPVDCWGVAERQISSADWQYLRDELFNKLNTEVRKAAIKHGWDFVDISSRSIEHGMCNCDEPYFNTIGQSLPTQGDINGTMHPNATGFREIYEEPLATQLERSIGLWHNELRGDAKARAIAKAKEKAIAEMRMKAKVKAMSQVKAEKFVMSPALTKKLIDENKVQTKIKLQLQDTKVEKSEKNEVENDQE